MKNFIVLLCLSLSLTGRAKESLSEHVFSSYKEVTYGNAFAYIGYLGLHGPVPGHVNLRWWVLLPS
jgi:hypothetical protein